MSLPLSTSILPFPTKSTHFPEEPDLPAMLDKLFPPSRDYRHERAWHDGNGHSHLQATMLGPSLTVPVRDGQLVLGTWQQGFYLEFDGKPRRRPLMLTTV